MKGYGTIIANLPVGYRPYEIITFIVDCAYGYVRMNIQPNGDIVILEGASGKIPSAFCSLSGISFRAGVDYMNYVVEKETGKFITSFVNDGDYEVKEAETVVTTEWLNGLYEPKYDFKNQCWINGILEEDLKQIENEGNLQKLRLQRESECFSIINRGQSWYDKLTEEQKTELNLWYEAWLEVTETMVLPEKLEWI